MWDVFIPVWNLVCENMTCLCFRENNNDGSKWACKCYQSFSWCKLNLMRGKQIHPKAGIFRSKNLVLSTVTSIHNIRKSTKYRNSEKKMKGRCETLCKAQMSNRSEKREIELINKEVWRERKQKVLNRINWFTHNVQVI